MEYRKEIDGIRALAVISVVLFHAGVEAFSGGFAGVDVFFVISGYLITTIIYEEFENRKFSIVNFYVRRLRRILPALFVMMLVCIPFAYIFLLPHQFVAFTRSLVAASLFSSNILFWRESGYFEDAASEKPLLHTWSLGIEGQFYFLYPIFIMITWMLGRKKIYFFLIILCVTSLCLAEWAAYAKPTANFFLLPTRGWEFLIGVFGCIYSYQVRSKEFNHAFKEVAAWLGVAMILFAVHTYSKTTPYPSFYALIPTLGALLIILCATKETSVGKILGNKLFVKTGLLSYSVYLWHLPIFSFARQIGIASDGNLIFLPLAVLVFIISYISWRFVETPFNFKTANPKFPIVKIAILIFTLFIMVFIVNEKYQGFSNRLTYHPTQNISESKLKVVMEVYGKRDYPTPRTFKLDASSGLMKFGNGIRKGVLMIGDSHANQYWNVFDEYYSKLKQSDNVKPLYVQEVPFPPELERLNLKNDIDVVVISYFWSLRYGSPEVNQYVRCCGYGPKGVIGIKSLPSSFEKQKMYDQKIEKLIEELKRRSIKVIIVLDNPFGEELNAQSMVRVDALNIYPTEYFIDLTRKKALSRVEPIRDRLMQIIREHGALYIDPFDYLCSEHICDAFTAYGALRYNDYDHLSFRNYTGDMDYILRVLDPSLK